MAQSFWSEPDVEKFNQYVDWLKKVPHTFSSDKRESMCLSIAQPVLKFNSWLLAGV